MKVRLLLPGLLMLTASCATYKVDGTTSVPTLDGQKLYLKVPQEGFVVDFDSCEVLHGSFKMKGDVDSVMLGALYVGGESLMPIVVERGNIRISIENSGLEVSGTPLNERLYDFIRQKDALELQLSEASHQQMQWILDGMTADEAEARIGEQTDTLLAKINKLIVEFVTSNFDNVLAPQIFSVYCQSFARPVMTPVIEEIMKNAPECFTENPFVKEYVRMASEGE